MIYEDIEQVIEMYIDDEERHYEESDKPQDHIYLKLKNIRDWLESPSCPLTEEDDES